MNIDVTEVKLEIYVPEEYIEPIRDALTHIGACRVGNYDHVMAFHCSRGSWRPLPGSSPFNGKTGGNLLWYGDEDGGAVSGRDCGDCGQGS